MPAAVASAGAAASAAAPVPATLPHERSRSGGSRRREKRRAATTAASTRVTLEELEQEILALKQSDVSRDIKVASLEAGLLELNDRLATAVRYQMATVQEVDVRFRAHIDKTVVDILAALQATDGNLRTLVGSACSALEDALRTGRQIVACTTKSEASICATMG